MTTTTAEQVAWTNIGTTMVPESARESFLAKLPAAEWVPFAGSLPASPGLALQAVIREYEIRPVVEVTYSAGWTVWSEGERCSYDILGVRTRKQSLYFVDSGVAVTPVAIITHASEAAA